MRITRPRDEMKLNVTGCIILPAALFIALMIATAGFALWPQLAVPGAAIVCGSGEVVHQAHEYRRPGEYSLIRQIQCQTGTGKEAVRTEITFSAMAVSFLIYAAALFLLLQFVVRPLAARRLRRRMAALGFGAPAQAGQWPGAPPSPPAPVDLGGILARVQDAVQRGGAEIRVSDASADLGGEGDVAARLARLKALRDQGLITAQDYEAKKAEILAGL